MNILALKHVIKDLRPIIHFSESKEYIFSTGVKRILPNTNFELLGEELSINHKFGVGKCDLWLANCSNNFLLSLELKVGGLDDFKKQNLLNNQVRKYTDLMKIYYPNEVVYGLGAYKIYGSNSNYFKYFWNDGCNKVNGVHIQEIDHLKSFISKC